MIIAFAVFVVTYFFIAARRFGSVNVRRDLVALLGGVLMLLFGIVTFQEAWSFIDMRVIFLLLGMMMLVAGLEFCGFFEIIVNIMMERFPSKGKLLIMVMLVSAVLSAIMMNDAVVLLFTPIVIRCCRLMRANPIPYLIAVFVSANIGSMATVVGNPQNAYVASVAGISFLDFSMTLVPISIICLGLAMLMVYLICRRNLHEKAGSVIVDHKVREVDKSRLGVMIVLTLVTVLFFTLSDSLGVPVYVIAMVSGMASLIVVLSKGYSDAVWMVKRINWSILVFFIGLFILMAGVVESGLLEQMALFFPGFGDGETPTVAGLTVFSAVLGNLISNVPSVMLIGEMLPDGDTLLWLVLTASSTIAGNATLMGAAANIIVAEESEKSGIRLNFFSYLKIGIPVSAVSLIAVIIYFSLL